MPYKTERYTAGEFASRVWPVQPGSYKVFSPNKSIAVALLAGVLAYIIGLWNADMELNEKGYYLSLIEGFEEEKKVDKKTKIFNEYGNLIILLFSFAGIFCHQ